MEMKEDKEQDIREEIKEEIKDVIVVKWEEDFL